MFLTANNAKGVRDFAISTYDHFLADNLGKITDQTTMFEVVDEYCNNIRKYA